MADERGELEGVVWRILRDAYLRARLHPRHPSELTVPEQNACLEPLWRQMEADLERMMAVIEHARAVGQGDVRAALHRSEGIDHEMIDEALEFAVVRR